MRGVRGVELADVVAEPDRGGVPHLEPETGAVDEFLEPEVAREHVGGVGDVRQRREVLKHSLVYSGLSLETR